MASEEVAEQALENLFNDKLGSANQKIGGATLVPFKWRRQFSGGILEMEDSPVTWLPGR